MGRGKLPSQSGRQSRPCQPGGNYKYGRGQFRNQRYERRSGYFTPGWRQKHSRGSPPPDGRTRPALRHSGPLCVRLAVLDQDSSGADLRYPDRHGHGPNCPPRSLPHHVDLRRSGAGPSSVGDHQRRGAQAEGVREDYPAGLPFEHRRRIRQAKGRLPQPGDRTIHFGLGNLSCPAVSVQQRHQAVPGFRGSALRRRRRDHHALDHAYLIWIHGLSRHCEPHWRNREPRDRALRLHRGEACPGRALRGSGNRRGYHPPSPSHDHGRRYRAGAPWRPAVAAAVLRANWWTDGGHIHYSVDGSGLLLYFRAGPESSFLGNEAGHFRVSYARSSKSVHCDCNLWRLVANLDQKYEAVLEKAMRIEGRSKLKFGILLVAALLVLSLIHISE